MRPMFGDGRSRPRLTVSLRASRSTGPQLLQFAKSVRVRSRFFTRLQPELQFRRLRCSFWMSACENTKLNGDCPFEVGAFSGVGILEQGTSRLR